MLRVRPDEQDAPAADGLRAGMTVSGVSRNNRVVQRQPQRFGAFWRSYDFNSSKGTGNMFKDPINLHPNGGEMIFNLPNGLQGYFVTNAIGTRLEEAPTGIVTDKFAEDKTVRNGLSCMRCHDQGIKGFHDNIRQAIDQLPTTASRDNGIDPREVRHFYPEQKQMDRLVDSDAHRFNAAMTAVLGHKQEQEPITPVSRQFLDAPLQLHTAAAELGLPDTRRSDQFFQRPRQAWVWCRWPAAAWCAAIRGKIISTRWCAELANRCRLFRSMACIAPIILPALRRTT